MASRAATRGTGTGLRPQHACHLSDGPCKFVWGTGVTPYTESGLETSLTDVGAWAALCGPCYCESRRDRSAQDKARPRPGNDAPLRIIAHRGRTESGPQAAHHCGARIAGDGDTLAGNVSDTAQAQNSKSSTVDRTRHHTEVLHGL